MCIGVPAKRRCTQDTAGSSMVFDHCRFGGIDQRHRFSTYRTSTVATVIGGNQSGHLSTRNGTVYTVIDTTITSVLMSHTAPEDSAGSISVHRFNTDRNSTSGCYGNQPVQRASRFSEVECESVQPQPVKSRRAFPTHIVLVQIITRRLVAIQSGHLSTRNGIDTTPGGQMATSVLLSHTGFHGYHPSRPVTKNTISHPAT